MQPDPSAILDRLSIEEPLIGFYDAPDPAPFAPLVTPGSHQCVFASLKAWRQGKTLHLTREKHGCGGGHLFGIAGRSRRSGSGPSTTPRAILTSRSTTLTSS